MDKIKNILNTPSNQWSLSDALQIFETKFIDLIFQSQIIHRNNFEPNTIQVSTLLSIKTGGCPENCSYCPQSAHYNTNLTKEPLMDLKVVIDAAKKAKDNGSTRFCMGAAWRNPRDKDLELVCSMVKEVKKLGLETCVTLGMLKEHQAKMLKEAGLDFYNHNIDTSPDYYPHIITTRNFEERLETLAVVGGNNIKICCGGILGMGETNEDRVKMLLLLAKLNPVPDSIPINKLIRIPGTPLENSQDINSIDFIKTIALARIMMPKSYIRLSAGRESMSDELQALCFFAGANSIFYGEKLLTASNAVPNEDQILFKKLGLEKLNNTLEQIPVQIV